ncbi:MAG: FtsX-like permease family protein, partial [Bryobacteraceae bacterium]
YYWTGPDYLDTMAIPLLRGRFLSGEDTTESEPVVVIDSLLERTYFPGRNPVGQTIMIPHWGVVRIVGVVGHVRHWGLDGSDSAHDKPQIYASFYQLLDNWVPAFRRDIRIIVRTPLNASVVMPAIKSAVYGADSGEPVYNVHTMQDLVAESMSAQRFPMILLGAFAILALLLACVGIYGVISYSMSQRIREIGIRMALGAEKRDILRTVIGQGFRLVLIGVVIGIMLAIILVRLLSSFSRLLCGVRVTDLSTLTAVPLVLISAALFACYLPARRASRLDAMIALRHE